MTDTVIQIKRSTSNSAPLLEPGELAYTGNGDVLFIGSPSGTDTANVIAIAGKRFPGVLTANQALVANNSSWIDAVKTAKLIVGATNETINVTSISTDGTLATVSNSSIATSWAIKNYIDNQVGATSLNGLTDVDISSPANNNILVYDAAAGQWENHTISGTPFEVDVDFTGHNITVGLPDSVTVDNVLSTNTFTVTDTTESSNTTTGAATIAGGLGVAKKINTREIAIGNSTVYSSANGTAVSTENVLATGTVNAATLSVGSWVVANTSGVFTSGVVNADIVQVGTKFKANTTQVTIANDVALSANGTTGTAGQVLTSNGTTVYWSTINADITAVTAGDGLTGGGSSGDVTLDIGAGNGITVNATAVAVNAGVGVESNSTGVHVKVGNSQLVANSTGLFVDQSNIDHDSLSGFVSNEHIDHSSVSISAGNGLSGGGNLTATRTLSVVANSGIIANTDGVFVNPGTGVTVNSTGVHIGQAVGTTDNVTFNVLTVNGNTALGNANTDNVSINGGVNTNILPQANVTYNLGSQDQTWFSVHANTVHAEYGVFDHDVTISGNLSVTGSLVTINVSTLAVTDSLIQLASNNTSSDTLDIGFYGNYQIGGGSHEHAGMFRDATDNRFKLFYGLTEAPSTTIDTGHASYNTGTLEAYLLAGALIANSTAVNITANSTVSSALVANSLTLTTALEVASGGTGRATLSNNAVVFGNGTGQVGLASGSNGQILQIVSNVPTFASLDGGTF